MRKNTFENYWYVLWVLTKTDFKLRYHGSVLGYMWSLLKPFLMFLVLYIVFCFLMKFDTPNFEIKLLLGIIIWNFFAESTNAGMMSLIAKEGIIKKIDFPHSIVVISSTLSALTTFILNILVFFVFYYYAGLGFHAALLLFPIYIIILYIFIVALSLILSILQVKFRDVSQIWEVLLQAGFFATPIIYPLSLIDHKYWFYLFLNPMTGIIQYSRMLLVEGKIPSPIGTLYIFVITTSLLIISYFIFKKLSPNITENL